MIAYNGSIPGPTLRVRQGSEISVRVRNDADTEATVHWHGLCLDNKYDGVPYETQDPIAIGGDFTYQVRFPDAGLYWYHPHIREDYGLDMGLYGNLVVEPADPDYWPPVNREFVVTLDDVLLEDGQITPYNLDGPNFVAMGRFGNVMLTGGESNLELNARAGEVVRFYFTNTANTRLFNVAIPGARMKLVGGDSGRYERHTFVEDVLLSPSERAIVDVLFETAGTFTIAHDTPTQCYILGAINVTDEPIDESLLADFEELRTCPDLTAQRARIDAQRDRAPDKTLGLRITDAAPVRRPGRDRRHVDLSDAPRRREHRARHVPALRDEAHRRFAISLDLSDASRSGERGAGDVPAVRDEAHRRFTVSVDVSDASRGGERGAGDVPAVRDEAHRRSARRRPSRRTRGTAHARHAGRSGVGGPDARDQPGIGLVQHDLEARRSRHRTGQLGDRLGIHGRRPSEDPPRQRSRPGPPDAPPVPHPRRRPIPRALPRRRTGSEPCVERHRPGAVQPDRRHPSRRHQSRPLDGALPHRGTQPERNDVQLPRH